MAEHFLHYLMKRYPQGNSKLEQLFQDFKTSQDEFSDCDEDELIRAADVAEKEYNRKRKSSDGSSTTSKKSKFECDMCNKSFTLKHHLTRHVRTHNGQKFACERCKKTFTRSDSLKKHGKICTGNQNTLHGKRKTYPCRHCDIPFDTYEDLFDHVNNQHPLNQSGGRVAPVTEQPIEIVQPPVNKRKKKQRTKTTALNGLVQQVEILPEGNEKYDLLQFFSNVKGDIEDIIVSRKKDARDVKWYLNVRIELERDIQDAQNETVVPHFRSKNYISLLIDDNFEHNLNEAYQAMNRALEEFINKGSNWIVRKVVSLEVKTVKYSPIRGSSYIKLPSSISNSKGVLNIENEDQKCFLWSVLAALHPAKSNPNRVNKYKNYETELKTEGITFPVALNQVAQFEKQNNLSINVFGYENESIFPVFLSKQLNGCREIDLLYISNETQSHYCLIKNLNKFLHQSNSSNSHHYCRRCLHGFIRKDLLDKHQPYCDQFDFQKINFPKEGESILEFTDFYKGIKISFTIVADFECFSRKINTCLPNVEKPSVTHNTKFEPSGYCYVVLCTNDNFSKPPVVYRGDDVIEHFFEDMAKEEECIQEILGNPELLVMNNETEREFQMATQCYVCQRSFDEKVIKVRDHNHVGLTGDPTHLNYTNYRGAACQRCNLSLQEPSFIPVLFHNGRNFDTHLLLQKAECFKDKKISCIPNNMEKYISLSIGNLRFLDTYQFMSSSLENLVENLATEGLTHFHQFRKEFTSEDKARLLLQKNEYCYDYVDSEDKFQDTMLPPKEAFFNRLSGDPISAENYKHAQDVWNVMNIQNLGQFHDLYVKTDVLLLADVFERFRDISMENYGLDPCHFYTAPGMAWQAALKMSGISLELITDPSMHLMVEIGTRGGMAFIAQRYAKANNTHMKDFDAAKPSSHILYTDCGNLYGAAMKQPLPTGLFRWLTEEEMAQFDVKKATSPNTGYLLDVDLEYPPHLHDNHNCYPLAPSHKKVMKEELSTYSKHLWEDLNGEKSRTVTEKLVPTLENKEHYILHYRNLQQYIELGMKVTKIHRILEFHQSAWLGSYIDFNSNKRKHARNNFEKDFYKLMNNAVFGKTMEQVRKHRQVTLVADETKLIKYTSKPSFDHFQIFNEHLVGVENKKVNLLLNKPIFVGQAILDISKVIMYQFHYKVMKPAYGDNLRLLFTDTDSLCYEILTDDVYQDLEDLRDHFDFSDYPPTHPLYSTRYKKVPGKYKDELNGIPIKEFVGLRPKLYSLIYDDGDMEKEKKTAKGVKKSAIKRQLRHTHYKKCLFDNLDTMNSMDLIRSQNHELYVNHVVKKGLCNFDDKRYWKNCINSYAFGHYKIST